MPLWGLLLLAVIVTVAVAFTVFKKRSGAKRATAPMRHIPAQRDPASNTSPPPVAQKATVQPVAKPVEAIELVEFTDLTLLDGTCPTAMKDVEERITQMVREKIGTFPRLPSDSIRLNEILRDPDSSANDVAAFVSTNPVLTARILQAVNSAFYNLQEKVTSVGRAIVLMGYNNVRGIVMHDSFQNSLPKAKSGGDLDYDQLWLHSMTVSACAHHLSQNTLPCPGHDLATIGLLHDIGKYFIQVLEVRDDHSANVPDIIQEEMRYGVNHALLGSMVAKHWKLSDALAGVIEYHHHPVYYSPEEIPEEIRKPALLIGLSDLICRALGYLPENGQVLPIRGEYYKLHDLPTEIEDIISPALLREIEKARCTVEAYIGPRDSKQAAA